MKTGSSTTFSMKAVIIVHMLNRVLPSALTMIVPAASEM